MAQDFEAIELNIAVARDNLAATLDEIADRVNPTNVVEKGKVAAQDALQKVEVQIALGIATAVILGTLVIRLARRK
jgi:putative membrane protein